MEQEYQKPLLLIVNEPPEYQVFFIDAFDEEFSMTFIPTLTPELKKQLKGLVYQEEICCAICGLDASGVTAQRSAWFAARQIFRMDIPIVCCTEQKYGDRTWKLLKGRFPELNTKIPYFALAEEDDFSTIRSMLHQKIVEKEQRERKRKKIWYRLGRFIKNRFAIS